MITRLVLSTALLTLLSARAVLSKPVNVEVFKQISIFKRQVCDTATGQTYCGTNCCAADQQCGSWANSQCVARTDWTDTNGNGVPDNQNGEWRTWTSQFVQTMTSQDVTVLTVVSTYSEWVAAPTGSGSLSVAAIASSSIAGYTGSVIGVYSSPVVGTVVTPTVTNTNEYTFPVPTDSGNSGLGYGGVLGANSGGSGLTGAQIGGIVGGVIGAIALILLLLLCCCLRKGFVGLFGRRRHGSGSNYSSHSSGHGAAKAGLLGLLLGSLMRRRTSETHSVSVSDGKSHGGGRFAALAGATAAGLTSLFASRRKSEKTTTGHGGYMGVGGGYGSEKYSSATSYTSYTGTTTTSSATRSTSGGSSSSSSSGTESSSEVSGTSASSSSSSSSEGTRSTRSTRR